uniref:SJCHGC06659 protein n=1 Tax=Schistosoma japonicum TaxID=6182 RepID=Q5D918_SCHJA|nr:SJCHGC06659 protein [Schistosoma japonicum]
MQQPNINPQIVNVFRQVDQNNNGSISPKELQQALHNGLGKEFNMKTVEIMMCMFDKDMNGTMDVLEFSRLFLYVQQWQSCFRNCDRDNSGTIDCREFEAALIQFGFKLSPQFVQFLIRKFDRDRRGSIGFDDFILVCVCLQNLTNAFKMYDRQQNGTAYFTFENFLTAAFTVVS